MSALPFTATVRYPTGFSEPSHREGEVEVIAFVYGKHRDAGGYDKLGECTLAVCITENAALVSVPISWLSHSKAK